jgi:hypothetical protein
MDHIARSFESKHERLVEEIGGTFHKVFTGKLLEKGENFPLLYESLTNPHKGVLVYTKKTGT